MQRKKILTIFLLIGFLFVPLRGTCEVFEYKHTKGDKYRILSVVKESVLVNRVLSHTSEILNRIAVEVTDANDGKGLHNVIFQSSERILYDTARRDAQQNVITGFEWTREYESVFERDKLGYLTIDPKYYMPVVRNVPVFPGRNIDPLQRWGAEGHEVHDFRDAFGITEPYRIPFNANYQFIGDRKWKGVMYPAFSVEYRVDSRPQAVRGRIWPRRITGQFSQIVYWSRERGNTAAYEEIFRVTFEMSDGRVIEYRGTAEAEYIEAELMDRKQMADEIAEAVEDLDIKDIRVNIVEEGVTLSLDDIGFYADSSVMLPGESGKLDKIAEILKRYPDRDILVGGHTALAGTSESRMILSTERARAVADYFLSKNVRTSDRIVIRGFGAEKPAAGNDTEEGRRKNRRVEITILEN